MAGLKRVLQAVEASEAVEKLDCFTQGLFKFEIYIQAKIAGGKGGGLVKGSCGKKGSGFFCEYGLGSLVQFTSTAQGIQATTVSAPALSVLSIISPRTSANL